MRIQQWLTQAREVDVVDGFDDGYEPLEQARPQACGFNPVVAAMHTEKAAVVATEKWFQVEYFRFRPEDFADNFHLACVPLLDAKGRMRGTACPAPGPVLTNLLELPDDAH